MVTLESIKIEYKVGAILGGAALLLSVIVGLAAGNTFAYTLGRAVFLGIIFVFLGTGLAMLLRKYVPELFEITMNVNAVDATVSALDADTVGGSSFSAGVTVADDSSPAVSSFTSPADGSGEQGFVPLGEYVAGQQEYGDEHLQTAVNKKLGKHHLSEKVMKFEPKIQAEAIRTMMSKE